MHAEQMLRSLPTSCSIDLGDGDVLDVVYDKNKLTSNWTKAAEERDNVNDVQSVVKALEDVLISWDVVEGEPPVQIPPTLENLSRLLSLAQEKLVLREVITHSMPSSDEGKDSSQPSETPDTDSARPTQPDQNGTTLTSSPTVSAAQPTS
jgi:hypothetical protein